MTNIKYHALILSFLLIFSSIGFLPVFAQQEVYVVSNNIDIVSKEILEDYFRGFGLFPEFLYPEESGQIKGAKLL